jgi:hypothetical protein
MYTRDIGHNEFMVCAACRERRHDECPGGNWCDCQHLSAQRPAEPGLGWVSQG